MNDRTGAAADIQTQIKYYLIVLIVSIIINCQQL